MKIYQSNIYILYWKMEEFYLIIFLSWRNIFSFGFGFSCKNSEKCSNLAKSVKIRYMKNKDGFTLDNYKQ